MSGFRDTMCQMFPPKAEFEPERDIPDLSGRIFFVTGANSGIGFHTTKELLVKNAIVYMGCRDRTKALAAIEELEVLTGKKGNARFVALDLSSLRSIKDCAEEYLRQETRLDCLFNNAGVMWCPIDQVTQDGYDYQFGSNVLGHFYLTQLLLPKLLESAQEGTHPNSAWQGGRVITTSSLAHQMSPDINWEVLKEGEGRRKLSTETLYDLSKLGNVIFAQELHRRYGNQGLISVSLNPGNIRTSLQRHISNPVQRAVMRRICYPVEFGALTQLYGGTTPKGADVAGKYLVPWARDGTETSISKFAKHEDTAKRLWGWMEAEVRAKQ